MGAAGKARGCRDPQCARGAWWQRLCGTHGDSTGEVLGGEQAAWLTLRTSADGGRCWGRGGDCEEEV